MGSLGFFQVRMAGLVIEDHFQRNGYAQETGVKGLPHGCPEGFEGPGTDEELPGISSFDLENFHISSRISL